MNSYEHALVGGMHMLIGNPLSEIEPLSRFGLEVNSKVSQVGRYTANGKESSSCRVRKITPFMTYKGVYRFEDSEHMAFLLPPGGVTGWKDNETPKDIYSLWSINDGSSIEPELVVFDYDINSIYIYKPEFKIVQ